MTKNEACGLLTTDTEGRIVEANPTLAHYLGCELQTLIGRPLISLFSPGAQILFQTQALPQLALRGRLDEFYITILQVDGNELPVLINAIPPKKDTKSAMHWAVLPMARRNRLETELIDARVKAQGLSIVREEAMKVAEAASRAKTAFLASMSHEIRTPMNAVLGMTTLLLNSAQNAEQREWTEIIRNSGEHLLELINDILDYSKIESGRFELERQAFSLPECLDAAISLVEQTANRRHLSLSCRIHGGVAEIIIGDAARLRQILLNLLSNAIKFTPEGGDIAIDVRPGKRGPDELLFSLRDSGVGISEEQRARLFQPFAQADASTARLYGGTGLGLSISRRLVEAMGGSIWVNSRPGQGSTFHFTAVMERSPETGSGLLRESATLRGRRALIIDPSEACESGELVHYCKLWGLEVRTAATLAEAQAQVEHGGHFDILLLDLERQGNGPAWTSDLASAVARLKSPRRVLVTSGSPDSNTRGYDAMIQHPINPKQLREVLDGIGTPTVPEANNDLQLPQQLGLRHPLRILIAEDNPVNVKLAKLLFNHMGYHPDFAGNGVEALAAVERQPYDTIFMDVQMPIMDGLQATQQLCETYPPDLRPRIVGMSASAMDEDRIQALAVGMDDYIIKPIVIEELVQSILRCARRTGTGKASNFNPESASFKIER